MTDIIELTAKIAVLESIVRNPESERSARVEEQVKGIREQHKNHSEKTGKQIDEINKTIRAINKNMETGFSDFKAVFNQGVGVKKTIIYGIPLLSGGLSAVVAFFMSKGG